MDSDSLTIRNVNEVFVKIDCDDDLAYELRDAFRFKVPGYQFTPQYRAKLWTGDIFLFNITNKQIYRGLVPHIFKICKDRGYRVEYEKEEYNTEFSIKEAQDFIKTLNIKYTPRDYQVDSFIHCVRNRRAMLLSPTSSGKSLIIYLILRYLLDKEKIKGLIIVPTTSLVEQLYADFIDYSNDDKLIVENNIHRIYQGKDKHSTKDVFISTWQSLQNMKPDYFRQFDFVICDEAHLATAKTIRYIMESCVNAKYRIGLTGTLK